MTAKELLNRIREIRRAINYRQMKIEGLNERAMRTTSSLSGMPRRGGDPSAMATAVCEKIDLEREVADLQAEQKELIKKIDELGSDALSTLLYLRYVRCLSWEEIMAKMGYCKAHIFRMHKEAIDQLEQSLKDETK